MFKMILPTILWLTLVCSINCYPNRHNFKIPDVDVSTPEEVNSLEREEPIGRSNDPQTFQNNKIEDTVKVVEEIIKSNPELPRLTRGEILDLLENITVTDKLKTEVVGNNRKQKAVMVVMPYTPSNDNNMEDLYTKAPVTHIIGAEPFKTKEEVNKRRRVPVQFNDADNDLAKKALPTEEKKKYSASIGEKTKPAPPRNQVRRKRPEATTQAALTTTTTTSSTTTYRPTVTTFRPKARRPVRRRTTQHPNHRYEEFIPNNGIRIIESPKLSPDLDVQENIKHEVVMKPTPSLSASFITTTPTTTTTTTTTTVPPTKPVIEEIHFPESLKNVVKDLNLKGALDPKNEEQRIRLEEQNRLKTILASLGISTTTTTTTAIPNAESVADSLSPEMRDLLMSFGLLTDTNPKPVAPVSDKYYPDKAEVKPESYIGFKPLPDDGPSRDDMDALLASFGLGRSARKEKSIKLKPEGYNFDMIPEHLKDVITDLGINREPKTVPTPEEEQTGTEASENQHIFDPEAQYATEEELEKLDKIMRVIKSLEKLNGTEEDLKLVDLDGLKKLVASLNGQNETLVTLDEQNNSPDPTSFDSGVIKNDVKRQESTTVSSTTVEAETPNLKGLEESFGGQTEAVTEAALPETTTRRTGFYYLVDWNTFLDIDDTKGKRVNLRFQPTIGDPKRFLSVSVP